MQKYWKGKKWMFGFSIMNGELFIGALGMDEIELRGITITFKVDIHTKDKKEEEEE